MVVRVQAMPHSRELCAANLVLFNHKLFVASLLPSLPLYLSLSPCVSSDSAYLSLLPATGEPAQPSCLCPLHRGDSAQVHCHQQHMKMGCALLPQLI